MHQQSLQSGGRQERGVKASDEFGNETCDKCGKMERKKKEKLGGEKRKELGAERDKAIHRVWPLGDEMQRQITRGNTSCAKLPARGTDTHAARDAHCIQRFIY